MAGAHQRSGCEAGVPVGVGWGTPTQSDCSGTTVRVGVWHVGWERRREETLGVSKWLERRRERPGRRPGDGTWGPCAASSPSMGPVGMRDEAACGADRRHSATWRPLEVRGSAGTHGNQRLPSRLRLRSGLQVRRLLGGQNLKGSKRGKHYFESRGRSWPARQARRSGVSTPARMHTQRGLWSAQRPPPSAPEASGLPVGLGLRSPDRCQEACISLKQALTFSVWISLDRWQLKTSTHLRRRH